MPSAAINTRREFNALGDDLPAGHIVGRIGPTIESKPAVEPPRPASA